MIQFFVAILLILLFFLILYLVITKKIEKIDHQFYQKVAKKINHTNTFILKKITFLGSAPGIIISIFISFFFIKNGFDRQFLVISIIGEAILNNLIKMIVKRIRPSINPLVVEDSPSFPSGHTMSTSVFYSLLIFFLWNSPIVLIIKIMLTIFAILIMLSVMFSRIYLGVHYLSDILGGICCGISYVLLITLLYPELQFLWI